MPSFELYKQLYGGKSEGRVKKENSDVIMENTMWNDLNTQLGYFYTQDLDDEFMVEDNLHPYDSLTKVPATVKFYEIEYNSLSKDEVGMHLMFEPSFNYKTSMPFYDDELGRKCFGAIFPNGLYCDLADGKGIFHRYLCVGQYRQNVNQFPSCILLPCEYKLNWIHNHKKMESWCVLRSQNSYNS